MSNDDIRIEEDDALVAESPVTPAGVAVPFETVMDLMAEILVVTGYALPGPDLLSADGDRLKIMAAGARLGQETRERGTSTTPSPNEVTALACAYFQDMLKGVVTLLRPLRVKFDLGKSAIQQLAAARAELAEKNAAFRAVDREASGRHVEAKVAEARETERAAAVAEVASLRAEVARQRSEIEALRASKKKLREALERAKEKR